MNSEIKTLRGRPKRSSPRDQQRVNLLMPRELVALIDDTAARHGMDRSEFARALFRQVLRTSRSGVVE